MGGNKPKKKKTGAENNTGKVHQDKYSDQKKKKKTK